MISYSKPDSDRFKINVHRGVFNTFQVNEIKNYLLLNNPDLLILRFATETIEQHHLLKELNYDVLFVDSLVYYAINLQNIEPKKLRNTLDFREVNEENSVAFNHIIPIIFKDYKNHYFANPNLPKEGIIAGYVEWASAYVNNIDENKKSWLVYKNEILIGFATCSMNKIDNTCEGVLYGVHPDYAGGGVYTDIIKFTQNCFKDLKFEKMFVSTQIQNYAVQKVWQKEGFLIYNAYYTYHLTKKQI
jgi:hypothetical protein